MKKGLFIFLRVIFVLLVMATIAFFGLGYYYKYQSKNAIENSLVIGNAPVIGDVSRPFSIVEFFDYRCPHCAGMSKVLSEIMQDDPSIKIILRPVVLRDAEAEKIASFVLAADAYQKGATVKLHHALMALPDIPDYAMTQAVAQNMGLDISQIEKNMDAMRPNILHNMKLVQNIGFYGVPALIIGDKGYMSRTEKPSVNEIRLMILDAKQRLGVK